MVGGNDNQCFVGVLLIEVESHAQGLVEVENFLYCRAAVVGMECVVDVAALDHHKEFVGAGLFKVFEACLGDERQVEHAID